MLLRCWMYTDDVFEIRRASVSVYYVHNRAQFEVNTTADRQPVHHHQAQHDVVANVQQDERDVLQHSGRVAVVRVLTAARQLVVRYSSLPSTRNVPSLIAHLCRSNAVQQFFMHWHTGWQSSSRHANVC